MRFSWFFFEHSENELYCWLGIDLEVSSWFFSSHFDFSIHYRVNFALLQLQLLTRAMDFELPNKKLWPYSKYIKLLPGYGFAASTWPWSTFFSLCLFRQLSFSFFLFLFSFLVFLQSCSADGLQLQCLRLLLATIAGSLINHWVFLVLLCNTWTSTPPPVDWLDWASNPERSSWRAEQRLPAPAAVQKQWSWSVSNSAGDFCWMPVAVICHHF